MYRLCSAIFRGRFFALSLAVHVTPFVSFGWFWPQSTEPSPPVNENPRGISLVYVEHVRTSATELETERLSEGSRTEKGHRVRPAPGDRGIREQIEMRLAAAKQKRVERAKERDQDNVSQEPESTPRALAASPGGNRPASRRPKKAPAAIATHSAGHPVVTERTPEVSPTIVDAELARERPEYRTSRALPEKSSELIGAALDEQQNVGRAAARPLAGEKENTHLAEASIRADEHHPAQRGLATKSFEGRRGQERAQQDREAAIERLRRRIERVMPLVYWDTTRAHQVVGVTRVRFRMDRRGYVEQCQIVETSGSLDVDRAVHSVLHMAEPYNYVPGWIELDLTFRG